MITIQRIVALATHIPRCVVSIAFSGARLTVTSSSFPVGRDMANRTTLLLFFIDLFPFFARDYCERDSKTQILRMD